MASTTSQWISTQSSNAAAVLPHPSGITPNYTHPDSISWQIYVAAGICIPLILVFSGAWLWTRLSMQRNKKSWQLDSLFGFTVAISLVYICTCLGAVSAGYFGKHFWDVRITDITKTSLILSFLTAIFYTITLYAVKLCIFYWYLTVFGRLKWMRYLTWAAIVFLGLFSLGLTIAWCVMCLPSDQSKLAWLVALGSPHCLNSSKLPVILTQSIINVLSDLYMIILPIPAVWSLQMPLKRKLGVSAIFVTGVIALVASILGLYFRVRMQHASHSMPVSDITRITVPSWATSIVEMTACVMVFCMPSFAGIFKRWGSSRRAGTGYTHSHAYPTQLSGIEQSQMASFTKMTAKSWSRSDYSVQVTSDASMSDPSEELHPTVPEITHDKQTDTGRTMRTEHGKARLILGFPRDKLAIRKQTEVTITHGVV